MARYVSITNKDSHFTIRVYENENNLERYEKHEFKGSYTALSEFLTAKGIDPTGLGVWVMGKNGETLFSLKYLIALEQNIGSVWG